jgi:hypothetical protein
MNNLEPINGQLDAMLTELTLTRNTFKAYSPYYQWVSWLKGL